MTAKDIVLSYGETLLRESDVSLLKGPYWLNDTIISFYFEFLEKDAFESNTSVLFVSPEVTQCIKISPQTELSIFLVPLMDNIPRDFIFFALNDNDVMDSSGGSHWSLLVLSVPEMMIFHFDSSNGSNACQARELGYKVARYFSFPQKSIVESIPCLQQTNGYDCGIHVLCNAEQLANHAIHHKKIITCPQLVSESVKIKRKQILGVIEQLKGSGNTS